MSWILRNIGWIMVLAGCLTLTMLYAAIAPQAALLSTFGETLEGPLATLIVRNWGVLIALMGGMLIYGGMRPAARPLVLIVAGTSKVAFIALILSEGARYLSVAGLAVAVDAMMILVFGWYLLAVRRVKLPRVEGVGV